MKMPKWKYDTCWSRITTKDKDGLQVVVIDQMEFKRCHILIEKANRFIRMKNIMSGRFKKNG